MRKLISITIIGLALLFYSSVNAQTIFNSESINIHASESALLADSTMSIYPAYSSYTDAENGRKNLCYGSFSGTQISDTTDVGVELLRYNNLYRIYKPVNNMGIEQEYLSPKEASTTPSTFFLSQQCYSFSSNGDWWQQGFTLGQTTTLVLRFATQYIADAAVFTSDQLSNFQNNNTFSGYGNFDNQIGYHTITLAAGSYYLGMRNQNSEANQVSIELDFEISLPLSDNYTYYDNYINGVENISANGGKLWHSFTIQYGYRYFIDGCNSGLEDYFIPNNQLSNFQNDQTFQYYSDYADNPCGEGTGLWEILLPAGTYYMVARNTASTTHSINYIMQRWKQNTSIEDLSFENKIIIYPNPSHDNITIENTSLNKTENDIISIYNVQGQLLLKQPMQQEKIEINISGFAKGVYVLKIESEEGVAVKRVVKE